MKTALVLYYNKLNKYSFNALLGALETEKTLDSLGVYFLDTEAELLVKLKRIVEKNEKTIVLMSFFTTQIWEIYKIVQYLKEKFGDKILCLAGGPHPSGDPVGTLKMGFDIVIKGEGEETLIEILKKVQNNKDYKNTKGIAFLNDLGRYFFTGWRPIVNLNKYPPFSLKYKKLGPIEITRGCPFFCSYCQTPFIFRGRIRHRTIKDICKYVRILKENKVLDIRFITPNAFSYGSPDGKKVNIVALRSLFKKVSKIMHPKGRIFIGSFPSEVRPDHVTKDTVDLVLKYANNDNLIIGAQSGSQRILDLCHRGHTVEDIYKAVKLTLKAGLKANVDFIFGLPGETKKDIKITMKLMDDLIKMGAKIHAHTFIPLPQTPFMNKPAGKIDNNIKMMIEKLTSKDVFYGDWQKQEKLANGIEKYFSTGKLY